jgi:diguanylate cyclase (GGDEF)-like protein
MDAELFEQRLSRAEELNVTAPWRESQQILDKLAAHLGGASSSQYARYMLLRSRNLALGGELSKSLDVLAELLDRDMTSRLRLRAYTRAANISYLARRFRQAFSYLGAALRMLEHPELRRYGDDVYGLASYTYALVDEPDRALTFGRLALDSARARADLRATCAAEQNLGFVYKQRGEWQRSGEYYRLALETCRDSNDELVVAIVEYGLADLMRTRQRFAEAQRLFERSLQRLRRLDYRPGIAEAQLYYARLEKARGDGTAVAARIGPILEPLRRERNWEYVAEAEHLVADVMRERGELDEALDHYDRYMLARERHMERVRDRQTAFVEIQFELRHTEQQLRLMQEQQRARELQTRNRAERRKLTLAIYSIAALVVIVLLALLVRARRDRRRFRRQSLQDSLTGLITHTRFFERAEAALEQARRRDQTFTLVLCDIDHFKQVNDNHGHITGDAVLREVALLLRDCFGGADALGRIGGEEFGIALTDCSDDELRQRLGEIRSSLGGLMQDDSPIPVTMSFGIGRPRLGETLTELRARTDVALYRAKQQGRDCFVDVDDDSV